jgi:hypothetical protein
MAIGSGRGFAVDWVEVASVDGLSSHDDGGAENV